MEKIGGPLEQYKRRQGPAEERKFVPKGRRPDVVNEKTQERRPRSEGEQMEELHVARTSRPLLPSLVPDVPSVHVAIRE
jgi:hypothetical protein